MAGANPTRADRDFLSIGMPAVQNGNMTDKLYQLGAGSVAQLVCHLVLPFPVICGESDLDEFMVVKGKVRFRDDGLSQTAGAQGDEGFQLMCSCPKGMFFFCVHGRLPVAECINPWSQRGQRKP